MIQKDVRSDTLAWIRTRKIYLPDNATNGHLGAGWFSLLAEHGVGIQGILVDG